MLYAMKHMTMGIRPFLQLIFVCVLSYLVIFSEAQPLHTNSRWIVNQHGIRVKLACVNWPSHLEPMLAEGLSKQPATEIAKKMRKMGFNCVRFTYPLALVNNVALSSLTVNQTFQKYGLLESLAGIASNNPSFVNITVMDAYKAVLSSMKREKLMVILDNQMSKPGWCCSDDDGNGFFHDKYFNPKKWKRGLRRMATLAKDYPNVVGMSLRNELRGPRENQKDWYRYMQEGAETVHAANPHVLVILSGLGYDTDLSFLKAKPVNVSFSRKLVFEMHRYAFTSGNEFDNLNLNDACGNVSNEMMDKIAFVTEKGFEYPLFVSEFGADLGTRGDQSLSHRDNGFLSCFIGMAAEKDWDFAIWALPGSYYLRQGILGLEDTYGLLDYNWVNIRNPKFMHRISMLQKPLRGPGWNEIDIHKAIFHPETGLCVVQGNSQSLVLGHCSKHVPFLVTKEKKFRLMDGKHYLSAIHIEDVAKLHPNGTVWETISNSQMHIATNDVDGYTGCLDVDDENNLIVTGCRCLSGDNTCEPTSQWFKLIDTTTIDPTYSP